MADIELVIKIPEDEYKALSGMSEKEKVNELYYYERIIADGIPLPKGHGKIGDLDALREEVSSWGMNDYEPSDFIDEIDRADTIIEADKER